MQFVPKDVDMFGADISFNCKKNHTGDDYSMDHSFVWKLLKDMEEWLRTVEIKVSLLASFKAFVQAAYDKFRNELNELGESGRFPIPGRR